MIPVLEAVPNVSVGPDEVLLGRMAEAVRATGCDLVHLTSDPDHGRSVLTLLGSPDRAVEACFQLARLARDGLDLREHRGVHPRVGALDVVPLVPLQGVSMADAVELARILGARLAAELEIPVYLYAEASTPPGRGLAEIRGHGGFEGLRDAPTEAADVPRPDHAPGLERVHPTAGATCVGARPLLLAWNVDVAGLAMDELRAVARELRERDGGFPGLRTLALELPRQERRQVSMNLEDVRGRDPFLVFRALETAVTERGGRVEGTEVIGLCPDVLLHSAGVDRLALLDPDPSVVVSSRLALHLAGRCAEVARELRRLAGAPESERAFRAGVLRSLARELDPYPPPDERA